MNDLVGSPIPDIPDITDATIMALNQQLTSVSTEYPWELPLWSQILITRWDRAHKQTSNHKKNHDTICSPSKTKSEPISTIKARKSRSGSNTHSSFELQPLTQPDLKQENPILRPVTPETLKDYLAKEKGFNFSSYNNKKAQLQTRKDTTA